MKNLFFIIAFLFAFTQFLPSQENTISEAEFKVLGNCGQCKSRIEKALKIKEVKNAKWNKQTKILKISYLSNAVLLDSLQQRISAVGHDTEKFKAPDSVYAKLPACCRYRDNSKIH